MKVAGRREEGQTVFAKFSQEEPMAPRQAMTTESRPTLCQRKAKGGVRTST